MRSKLIFLTSILLISLSTFGQTREVKGLITFKFIKKDAKTHKVDTINEVGKYTMITLFNKMDSKLIAISDSTGYYYFFLDKETEAYTHIQFYNDYGIYQVYKISDLKEPFHDVTLTKDETVPTIKGIYLSGHDAVVGRMNNVIENKLSKKKVKEEEEFNTETNIDLEVDEIINNMDLD